MNRKLTTLVDAESALKPFIPLVKELTGKDTVMDRIVPLMGFLGHPENQIKTIHIAGTSGKTSTAYYTASLLKESGRRAGLTVSPHVDKVTERVQINGQPISDSDFCKYLSEFLELVNKSRIKPSYFELLYAFSIWLFAKLKVDYAVIETGVGGLYDATNVVTREDKVCILTDIGFDHMKLLGNSLGEIAAQKVGIVHKGNNLLMYRLDQEVMSVIEDWVKKSQANIHLTSEEAEAKINNGLKHLNLLPAYQKRNWLLAYYAYRFVAERDNLPKLNIDQLTTSQSITIPARMDKSTIGSHQLIMDGAHNYQKISTFSSSYQQLYPGAKPAVLLAFKSDKAYLKTLPIIKDLASEIIVTSFKTSQDLPVTPVDPNELARELKRIGVKNIVIEPDNFKAYQKLLRSHAKELVITGSFYLIAQIREEIRNR